MDQGAVAGRPELERPRTAGCDAGPCRRHRGRRRSRRQRVVLERAGALLYRGPVSCSSRIVGLLPFLLAVTVACTPSYQITVICPAPVTLREPGQEPDDDLGPELLVLEHARAALDRGNFEEALAAIDEHVHRWPDGGQLANLRENLRAQALKLRAKLEPAQRAR